MSLMFSTALLNTLANCSFADYLLVSLPSHVPGEGREG